jgi:hypothetical protein
MGIGAPRIPPGEGTSPSALPSAATPTSGRDTLSEARVEKALRKLKGDVPAIFRQVPLLKRCSALGKGKVRSKKSLSIGLSSRLADLGGAIDLNTVVPVGIRVLS